jgi:hypothetical protein
MDVAANKEKTFFQMQTDADSSPSTTSIMRTDSSWSTGNLAKIMELLQVLHHIVSHSSCKEKGSDASLPPLRPILTGEN